MENKISAEIKAEMLSAVFDSFKTIEKNLPFLINLSADDVKNLPKFGDKSRAFVEKALELAMQDDSFLPRKFDLIEMRKDVDLYHNLYKIQQVCSAIQKKIDDTLLLAGSEAYAGALSIYAAAKNNNHEGELDTLVDELSKRFIKKQRAVNEKV